MLGEIQAELHSLWRGAGYGIEAERGGEIGVHGQLAGLDSETL